MSRPATSVTALRSTLDAAVGEHRHQGRCQLRVPPARTVVVVAEDAEGRQPAARRVRVDAPRVRRHAAIVLGEVAGEDDDVGRQRADAVEDAGDVVVVDARPDVQVAELHEACGRRAPAAGCAIGSGALDELDPVRLDAPGVEAGAARRAPPWLPRPRRRKRRRPCGSPFLRPHLARRHAELAQQRRHVLDHRRRSAQVAHRLLGRQRALQGLDRDPAARCRPRSPWAWPVTVRCSWIRSRRASRSSSSRKASSSGTRAL